MLTSNAIQSCRKEKRHHTVAQDFALARFLYVVRSVCVTGPTLDMRHKTLYANAPSWRHGSSWLLRSRLPRRSTICVHEGSRKTASLTTVSIANDLHQQVTFSDPTWEDCLIREHDHVASSTIHEASTSNCTQSIPMSLCTGKT